MKQGKIAMLVRIALGAALITVCSWFAIPYPASDISFTLQTFAVFAIAGLLGWRAGCASVLVWIALGACGVPVFSGFSNLYALIAKPSAGYVVGFLFIALIVGMFAERFGRRLWSLAAGMVLGLLVCYFFGTAWFVIRYASVNGAIALGSVLGMCVVPYLPVDAAKIVLAVILVNRIYPLLARGGKKTERAAE